MKDEYELTESEITDLKCYILKDCIQDGLQQIEPIYIAGAIKGVKWLIEAQSRANDIAGEKEQSQWIDVNERLPELDTNVLAWEDSDLRVMCLSKLKIDGGGYIVWCDCGDNINGDGHFDDNYNVTHWQPLPTPPQK